MNPPPEQPSFKLYNTLPPKEVLAQLALQPVVFDLETYTLDATHDQRIRSVSFANDAGCIAIDLDGLTEPEKEYLWDWLFVCPYGIIAYNMVYDLSFFPVRAQSANIEQCTLAMFKLLATEGWAGQTHGLTTAQSHILGWQVHTKQAMKNWLAVNGKKSHEMSYAPWELLGEYNALDSASTWLLYKYFKEVLKQFPGLEEYHKQVLTPSIRLLIEQQWAGMSINLDKLCYYKELLVTQIEDSVTKFLTEESVAPHVHEYNSRLIKASAAKRPKKYGTGWQKKLRQVKIWKEKYLDLLYKEPKIGTKAWQKWEERKTKMAVAKPEQPTREDLIAPSFKAWRLRHDKVVLTQHFNHNSSQQKRWLFYECLGNKITELTDGGDPRADKEILPTFGLPGRLLVASNLLRDRLKFVTSLEEVQRDGVLRPQCKIPGTKTGRLSGGKE